MIIFLSTSGLLASDMKTNLFGYLEGYFEKVEKKPSRQNGSSTSEGVPIRVSTPQEFDTPHVNIMMKSIFGRDWSAFLNLSASSSVTTQNAWVEKKFIDGELSIRLGKFYRPFGLYNERLDAVPTYIGIEPPELFDQDHLLLTRTTNFMLHGEISFGESFFRYSLTTGNDERLGGEVPIGGDLRYTFERDDLEVTVGSSFYFSNGSSYKSDNLGGVPKWFKSDKYNVFGGFTEILFESWQIQSAFFQSNHSGLRNGQTLQNISTEKLNNQQIQRLCNGNMSTCADTSTRYQVLTWYGRIGRSFILNQAEFTPYIQFDFYKNPEMIAHKSDGGDNEAGIADDGKFTKQTIGFVYRPVTQVAIKVDASNHSQVIAGKNQNYSEIRSSFSYIWAL